MTDNTDPTSATPPFIPHDKRYGWNGSANAQSVNSRAAWWGEPRKPLNLAVYFALLALSIIGLIASIGDRFGDDLWGYFPMFLSAALYAVWMTLTILIRPSATGGEGWARFGYASLVAPLAIAIPTSIAFAIVYFAAGLGTMRDRHYFWGEGLSTVFLIPIASWFVGALATLATGVLVVILSWLKNRNAPQRPVAQEGPADAPTPAPAAPHKRVPLVPASGELAWPQEFRSLFTWPTIVVFALLFGVAAYGTYRNVGEPWLGWGVAAFPFQTMLFSMWLVLEAIWRRPDRIKIGKLVTIAALIAPLVFVLLQLAVAAVSAQLNPEAPPFMPLGRLLPFATEPGMFITMGILFSAAIAAATWLISGTVTALLRGWARRHPIATTQPRLIRYSTAMIGVGITPFVAGWLAHYWLGREFGITWRMLRMVIGSGAPDLAPFLVIWVTIIVLLYGGGALLIGGIALGLLAIRRRYVTATTPVTPVPLPATTEAAPLEVPANFIELKPGEQPHPDSPLAEYLATVKYDGPAATDAAAPKPRTRWRDRVKRGRRGNAGSLEQ